MHAELLSATTSCDRLMDKMENGGDVCMAVYAVPSGSSHHTKVDPCWKGPHITLAGFQDYTSVPGGSHVDLSGRTHYHIGRALSHTAQVHPQRRDWHVTPNNSIMRSHHLAVNSHTLKEIVRGLGGLGFSDLKPTPGAEWGLHVTFDRDQCPEWSGCERLALHSFSTDSWHLYPVMLDNCSDIDTKTQCPTADNLQYCHGHVSHAIRS